MNDISDIIIHKKLDLIMELLIEILREKSPRTSLKYYNLYEELKKELEDLKNESE